MLKVLKKIRLYGSEDEQGSHSLLAFLTIDPEDGLRWVERERESHTHADWGCSYGACSAYSAYQVSEPSCIAAYLCNIVLRYVLSSKDGVFMDRLWFWPLLFYIFRGFRIEVPIHFYISWDYLHTNVFAVMVMVDEQENQQRRAQHRLQHPLLMWRLVYQQQLQTPQQEASHRGSQYLVKKPRLFG